MQHDYVVRPHIQKVVWGGGANHSPLPDSAYHQEAHLVSSLRCF